MPLQWDSELVGFGHGTLVLLRGDRFMQGLHA